VISVLDYGMGNIGSILNMLKWIGVESEVCDDLPSLKNVQKLVLPGVGAFDHAMSRIRELGMFDMLNQKALVEEIPILGICLGMQLMTRGSEEGEMEGFGWIPAEAQRFTESSSLKIPHMGWNVVNSNKESELTLGFEAETRFYFVHSYAVFSDNPNTCILETSYGVDFDSAIQKGQIFGVQFHPEKSHRFGAKLFRNFANL
jgi:glutamine amidotransferase